MMVIYALCDPETQEPKYIGQTKDPQSRIVQFNTGTNGGQLIRQWVRQLRQKGQRATMRILEEVNELNGDLRERWWIETFRQQGKTLLNRFPGGHEHGYGPMETIYLRVPGDLKVFLCNEASARQRGANEWILHILSEYRTARNTITDTPEEVSHG